MVPRIGALVASGLLSSGVVAAQQPWTPPDDALVERARALLREVPLVDGHNDLPSRILEIAAGDPTMLALDRRQPDLPADIPRLREGIVGAQFWSAYVPSDSMGTGGSLRHGLREIDMVHRIVASHQDLLLARTAADVERIFAAGGIASLIGVEGGHAIDNSLSALRLFHALGVRYITLTHFLNTEWADAATDFPRHAGLTEFGEEVVREMNRLGIFVDLSHVSAQTMRDALRVSRAPVIFSHSNVRAINAHPRNVPDDVLRLVARNGGVVMINFVGGYIAPTPTEWRNRPGAAAEALRFAAGRSGVEPAWGSRRDSVAETLRGQFDDEVEIARRLRGWIRVHPAPQGTIADVADHIEHVRRVAGIDHIGVGSDYYTARPETMVAGLADVTTFPLLFAELLRRGYSDADVQKVAGLNLLRAMKEMERVAAELRQERRPSLADLHR